MLLTVMYLILEAINYYYYSSSSPSSSSVTRVTSIKSLIGILTHQGDISKGNANHHSVSKSVTPLQIVKDCKQITWYCFSCFIDMDKIGDYLNINIRSVYHHMMMMLMMILNWLINTSCRDPGHRRQKWCCVSIGWVLVGRRWSGAGELCPQRLPKGDVQRPNSESCFRSPGRLLLGRLRDLQRGILAAFAGHGSHQVLPQQCDKGGRGSTHRWIFFKLHRMDPSGWPGWTAGPVYCPTWILPLHKPA